MKAEPGLCQVTDLPNEKGGGKEALEYLPKNKKKLR